MRSPEVSAANWLEAPHNRWSMWNLRELVATQRVPRGTGPVLDLPEPERHADLDAVPVTRVDGTPSTVSALLEETYTDAFAVLQDGQLVGER